MRRQPSARSRSMKVSDRLLCTAKFCFLVSQVSLFFFLQFVLQFLVFCFLLLFVHLRILRIFQLHNFILSQQQQNMVGYLFLNSSAAPNSTSAIDTGNRIRHNYYPCQPTRHLHFYTKEKVFFFFPENFVLYLFFLLF